MTAFFQLRRRLCPQTFGAPENGLHPLAALVSNYFEQNLSSLRGYLDIAIERVLRILFGPRRCYIVLGVFAYTFKVETS